MTWQSILLAVLAGVDVAALGVGLTILRRVRRIVVDAGAEIHQAVQDSIADAKSEAVGEFSAALSPALAGLASHLPTVIGQALEHVRVEAGGHLVIDQRKDGDI